MTFLFDQDVERVDESTSRVEENFYQYLNRSSRPESAVMRNTLESFFSQYPEESKISLKQDFQSAKDLSPFSELFVHACLLKLGMSDIQIHPELPHTPKKPDFKFQLNTQEVICEVKNRARNDNLHLERLIQEIHSRRFSTTGFMLSVEISGVLDSQVAPNRVISFLNGSIQSTNTEEIFNSSDDFPVWEYDHSTDCKIKFTPIPCTDRNVIYEEPIGSIWGGVVEGCDTRILKQLMKEKFSRYGELQKPYIVVINFEPGFLDEIDIKAALFGSENWICRRDGNGIVPAPRSNNGMWYNNRGTRVSGVLILNNFNPGSFVRKKPVLWINPWALNPLDISPFEGKVEIKKVNLQTNRLELIPGIDAGSFLEISGHEWES